MDKQAVGETETTTEGLAALTRHVVTGSIKGELDPKFIRTLAERIANEYDAMFRCGRTDGEDADDVVAAMNMLKAITDSNEGTLLSCALNRLRSADADADELERVSRDVN